MPPWRRRIEVLKGADLEVRRGELVGLVGENGSGKSTLMKIVVGLLERDAGDVERGGKLGYCPQTPLLWEKLTVDEHFALFARAYALGPSAASEASAGLLEELQFERYRGYRIEELSGGTRQKLNLALALMHEPDLLLLDEPYSGFDWETYLHFWEMGERRRDRGMGILIVSHFLAERGDGRGPRRRGADRGLGRARAAGQRRRLPHPVALRRDRPPRARLRRDPHLRPHLHRHRHVALLRRSLGEARS